MLSGYVAQVCLSDFEMVPVALLFTGISFVFNIPHELYFYCKVYILESSQLPIIIIIIIIIIIMFKSVFV